MGSFPFLCLLQASLVASCSPPPGFPLFPSFPLPCFRASSSLPTPACSGVRFSCVGLESPIRSRGRLPVGLGSLQEIVNIRARLSPTPLSLCLRPATLSRMDVLRTVKSKKRCPRGQTYRYARERNSHCDIGIRTAPSALNWCVQVVIDQGRATTC